MTEEAGGGFVECLRSVPHVFRCPTCFFNSTVKEEAAAHHETCPRRYVFEGDLTEWYKRELLAAQVSGEE